MKSVIIVAALLLSTALADASPSVVFRGQPSVKVSEGGVSRLPEQIDKARAGSLECIIGQDGDSYFWLSRDKVQLVRMDSGAFTTYVAANGSGYVRVVAPSMKDAAKLMSETEEEFDYVEHLSFGLRSVTYYGINGF